MVYRLLYALLLLCSTLVYADLSNSEKIASLAKTLPQDVVFYRWQSRQSAESLLKAGEYSDELYRHFSEMPNVKALQAGRGIYVAEDPASSAKFMPENGTLIEVRVKKGELIIDCTDHDVQLRLREMGLTEADVYADKQFNGMVKYNGRFKWWVTKGRPSISFQPIHAEKFSSTELNAFYSQLPSHAKPAFLEATHFTPAATPTDAFDVKLEKSLAKEETKTAQQIFDNLVAREMKSPTTGRVLSASYLREALTSTDKQVQQQMLSFLLNTDETYLQAVWPLLDTQALLTALKDSGSRADQIFLSAAKFPEVRKLVGKSAQALWENLNPEERTTVRQALEKLAQQPPNFRKYKNWFPFVQEAVIREGVNSPGYPVLMDWIEHYPGSLEPEGLERLLTSQDPRVASEIKRMLKSEHIQRILAR